MGPRAAALACLILALHACPAAAAITVDGTLDDAYGAALVTQTTQTGLITAGSDGDNTFGQLLLANGSELDAGYGVISDGVLHLFLAGNLAIQPNPIDPGTFGNYLLVFLDVAEGGMDPLQNLGPSWDIWAYLNGLRFDSGFAPDQAFWMLGNTLAVPPGVRVLQNDLTVAAPTAVFLGGTPPGAPGTLSGGTNPYGVQATIDNRNVAGVTFGCGASSGAGVTTGTEWAIPLAAIGDPTGCIKVCAIVTSKTGSVSNQALGPVPAGTCPPGAASGVDLSAIAGDQYFTVCPGSVPVKPGTWGALKGAYR